jgi:hypothetical protein
MHACGNLMGRFTNQEHILLQFQISSERGQAKERPQDTGGYCKKNTCGRMAHVDKERRLRGFLPTPTEEKRRRGDQANQPVELPINDIRQGAYALPAASGTK